MEHPGGPAVSEQAWTKEPWEIGVYCTTAAVNDGTHKDWKPPKYIAHGECSLCGNESGELLRTYRDERGKTFHVHKFKDEDANNWRSVYGGDGSEVIGMYDYEEGGVKSSKADAERIVACVNACAGIPTAALPDVRAAMVECREALEKITQLKYGYDGDCGAVAIAEATLARLDAILSAK
jgi:hypothetical protein